jgi:hypothetical protein
MNYDRDDYYCSFLKLAMTTLNKMLYTRRTKVKAQIWIEVVTMIIIILKTEFSEE